MQTVDPAVAEKWSCKDCGKLCAPDPRDYYMVKHEIWEEFGVGKGMLCMDCMEVRLGRKLTESDIHRCQLTEFDNPYTAAILKQSKNDRTMNIGTVLLLVWIFVLILHREDKAT